MKRVSFYSIALLFAGIIAALSVSCRQEETAAPLASLTLNVDGATAESITFTLTSDANTACYYYACTPTSDNVSRTSSNLKGLMIATTCFTISPFSLARVV